ncbi:PREDICTED: DNA repair protein RAD51 homolog 2-like isoform X2 [Tarenaya hassleriana]|nr:PREDICTED: DNA repair protein RAD51 homolog 2-like isoform X2 [Tarenaya hassleriana]
MELLIVGLVEWVALITESNSPQGQYHLPTRLNGLDAAVYGGIPCSVLTELLDSYPHCISYIFWTDVMWRGAIETFLRMIEIGLKTFPKVFHLKEMAQEVAARADDGKNSCFATDFTEKP